jgi:hypothetical protein
MQAGSKMVSDLLEMLEVNRHRTQAEFDLLGPERRKGRIGFNQPL